jgi:hypothetical protein
MEKKQAIAIGIALQTQVLKTCPVHRQLYFDDDVNPACAFALAIELVRKHKAYVEAFDNNEHELTDLLSETLRTSPECCPECQAARLNSIPERQAARLNSIPERSRFGESAFEGR